MEALVLTFVFVSLWLSHLLCLCADFCSSLLLFLLSAYTLIMVGQSNVSTKHTLRNALNHSHPQLLETVTHGRYAYACILEVYIHSIN